MVFDPTLNTYWSGIQIYSSGVFFPFSDLDGTTNCSGDARQLLYALNNQFYDQYSQLPSSGTSEEMSITRLQSFSNDYTLTRRYNLSFNLGFSGAFEVPYESGL